MEVEEFAKPKGRWCTHAVRGSGCSAYDRRPSPCRAFFCAYLARADVPETWRPEHCHIVLVQEDGGRRLIAHVDPDFPDAWRQAPHYDDLKRWAQAGLQVAVYVDKRVIVLLPDRETDLGVVRPDEQIIVQHQATPFGRRFKALKLRKAPG
jgi:hypothetical protein